MNRWNAEGSGRSLASFNLPLTMFASTIGSIPVLTESEPGSGFLF
jgi:hypothetical protein